MQYFHEQKFGAFLELRPYSAFIFGGRNRKTKAENFPFWPKLSASGIPLLNYSLHTMYRPIYVQSTTLRCHLCSCRFFNYSSVLKEIWQQIFFKWPRPGFPSNQLFAKNMSFDDFFMNAEEEKRIRKSLPKALACCIFIFDWVLYLQSKTSKESWLRQVLKCGIITDLFFFFISILGHCGTEKAKNEWKKFLQGLFLV